MGLTQSLRRYLFPGDCHDNSHVYPHLDETHAVKSNSVGRFEPISAAALAARKAISGGFSADSGVQLRDDSERRRQRLLR